MEPKKVVIIGEDPFLRGPLVQALSKEGYRVLMATSRPAPALAHCVSGHVGQINSTFCDIFHEAQLDALFKDAYAVINLLRITRERGNRTFERMHVEATQHLAKSAKRTQVTYFLHLSEMIDFDRATSKYARSRQKAEQVLTKTLPTATLLRTSYLFGHGDPFLESLGTNASLSFFVALFQDRKNTFFPLHVGDFSEAVTRLLGRNDIKGRTFEFLGPEGFSAKEMAARALAAAGRKNRHIFSVPYTLRSTFACLNHMMPFIEPTYDLHRLKKDDPHIEGRQRLLADLGVNPRVFSRELPGLMGRFRPHF
ncbi:MAG: hypothetical protein ACK5TR_07445 [Alphaproteobacteria bacterium]|jgi:uncharacterized protein YbjT (DUF2867 family)|nr:sugar nucleotide-binding protein [Alphaproteobacteria bacterium]